MHIKFLDQEQDPIMVHQCNGVRKGDWIIYTCPHCADYAIHQNYVSGEFKRIDPHDSPFQHQGHFVPVGLEDYCLSEN